MHTASADIAAAAQQSAGVLQVAPDFSRINMTHHITQLRFGQQFPGRVNALDGFDRIIDHDYGTFKYFLTIVPVRFVSPFWRKLDTYSYSVSEYFTPGHLDPDLGGSAAGSNVQTMPSLRFRLDMSPIAMRVWYPDRAIGHFAVRLCAVLGGCFALTRWTDRVVHGIASFFA